MGCFDRLSEWGDGCFDKLNDWRSALVGFGGRGGGTLRQAQCPAGEWKGYVLLDNGKPCGEVFRSMEVRANGASMELYLAAIRGIKTE